MSPPIAEPFRFAAVNRRQISPGNAKRSRLGLSVIGLAATLSFAADASRAAELRWRELPQIPNSTGLAGAYAGVSNGALLVAGGANFPKRPPWEGGKKVWHDAIYVLDKPNGKWRTARLRLPRPLAYGVSVTAAGGVVCIGGGDSQRHYKEVFVLRWDGRRVLMERMPALPEPIAFSCGAVAGNRVYVAGGLDRPDAELALRKCYTLELSPAGIKRGWQPVKPWPGAARLLAVAAGQGGSFYMFSGARLDSKKAGPNKRVYLQDAFRYSPAHGWKRLPDLPRPAVAAPSPAAVLPGGAIAIVGGDDGRHAFADPPLNDKHPGFHSDVLKLDLGGNRWRVAGRFPKRLGPDPASRAEEGHWPPVTVSGVTWRDLYALPSGEARPGIRTSRVMALELGVDDKNRPARREEEPAENGPHESALPRR